MMNYLILNGHFQDTIFQKFGSKDYRKFLVPKSYFSGKYIRSGYCIQITTQA